MPRQICSLFPSETETFGNVTLEAMASGLVVVAYDYAAAKLHIRHRETGVLVPYGNSKAFVDPRRVAGVGFSGHTDAFGARLVTTFHPSDGRGSWNRFETLVTGSA